MEWYSFEEEYEDENGETKTRTQYKYLPTKLTKSEMQEKGYTYMGKTYIANNTYYSLFGAQLTFEPDSPMSMDALQTVMVADLSASMTVKAFTNGMEFWDNYNQFISSGSDAATVIAHFANASQGLKIGIGAISRLSSSMQLLTDGMSILKKNMHGGQYADAVFNVISMMGWKGSAVSLGYHTVGKPAYRGAEKLFNFAVGIPQAITNRIYSIRDDYMRMF